MKVHTLSSHFASCCLAIVALLVAGLVLIEASAEAQAGSIPDVQKQALSFDLWCLEMQRSPARQCDARRSDDTNAYERYRASVERYAQQRGDYDSDDQQLKDRLNREPGYFKQ